MITEFLTYNFMHCNFNTIVLLLILCKCANVCISFKSMVFCVLMPFQTFQDEGLSNYIVVYLRLLTSAQLQKKSDFFENFIEGGRTVQEFRSQVINIYLLLMFYLDTPSPLNPSTSNISMKFSLYIPYKVSCEN